MTIAVDTNVLLRAVIEDNPAQARLARALMRDAPQIAIATIALYEVVWVLSSGYGLNRRAVGDAIQTLLNSRNIVFDRDAAESGLAMLRAGGDFADGVLAFEGRALGGETFVSFGRKAVNRLSRMGFLARSP